MKDGQEESSIEEPHWSETLAELAKPIMFVGANVMAFQEKWAGGAYFILILILIEVREIRRNKVDGPHT